MAHSHKLWLAVGRAIGGLIFSGVSIFAAYQSTKNKKERR